MDKTCKLLSILTQKEKKITQTMNLYHVNKAINCYHCMNDVTHTTKTSPGWPLKPF